MSDEFAKRLSTIAKRHQAVEKEDADYQETGRSLNQLAARWWDATLAISGHFPTSPPSPAHAKGYDAKWAALGAIIDSEKTVERAVDEWMGNQPRKSERDQERLDLVVGLIDAARRAARGEKRAVLKSHISGIIANPATYRQMEGGFFAMSNAVVGILREEIEAELGRRFPNRSIKVGAMPAVPEPSPLPPDGTTTVEADGLEFTAGAIKYGDRIEALKGKPYSALKAIYSARHREMTLATLKETVWSETKDIVTDRNIRVTISLARDALRRLFVMSETDDPLPCINRGDRLTAYAYRPVVSTE